MSLDLIVFGFYLAVVVTVGILVSRKREQSEDYFLASRNLTWWIIGGSMIAANISTHQKTLQRDSRGHLVSLSIFVDPDGQVVGWHDFGNLEGPGWAARTSSGRLPPTACSSCISRPRWLVLKPRWQAAPRTRSP